MSDVTTKRRRGRPELPDHKKRGAWVVVRMTPQERAEIESAAAERKMTISEYLRSLHNGS